MQLTFPLLFILVITPLSVLFSLLRPITVWSDIGSSLRTADLGVAAVVETPLKIILPWLLSCLLVLLTHKHKTSTCELVSLMYFFPYFEQIKAGIPWLAYQNCSSSTTGRKLTSNIASLSLKSSNSS